MNMQTNLSAEIAQAERAGDAALLASIARQLLIERAGTPLPTPKPARPAAGDDAAYLTRTERLARGLPPLKESKIAGGPYRWVLVEFANGVRMVTGQYPRMKDPDNIAPSIISARARYLGILSPGRQLDAKFAAKVPRIKSARLIDADEAERERVRCMHMRTALAAFAPGGLADRVRAMHAKHAKADARLAAELAGEGYRPSSTGEPAL